MKKILALATVILLSSCSSEIVKEIKALPRGGKPAPEVSTEELSKIRQSNSIRKYLKALGFDRFASVGDNLTIITAREIDSGVDAVWNYIPEFYSFCKAHGGDLVSGKGVERVSYSSVENSSTRFRYFGPGKTFRCEGGNYPFQVEHIKGRAWNSSSVLGTIYEAILVVKHKPEPLVKTDFGFFSKDVELFPKLNLSEFMDREKRETYIVGYLKLGSQRWRARLGANNPMPFSIPKEMIYRIGFLWHAVEYCQLHGGELQKDGKPLEVWFGELAEKDGLYGYPYETYDGAGRKVMRYPLKGFYRCVGGDQPFEMKIKPYRFVNDQFQYEFFLQAGNSNLSPGTSENEEPTPQVPQSPLMVGGLFTKLFAVQAANEKMDLVRKKGAVLYKAFYNGEDSLGCELVSVAVNNAGSVEVYNYKICDGKPVPLGNSELNLFVPPEVEKAEKAVAKQAADYGKFSMEINGYKLIGKALRDELFCKVEVRVLQNGKLVRIDKIDACR
ncbi:hypothetical protein [Desulfurobacterium crinifex]